MKRRDLIKKMEQNGWYLVRNAQKRHKIGGLLMKVVYPVVISKGSQFLLALVPDCNIDTQGNDLADIIDMARDAISLWCVAEIDAGRNLPTPSHISSVPYENGEFVTLIDADIDTYEHQLGKRKEVLEQV